MIVVMKSDASMSEIRASSRRLESMGSEPRPTHGAERTIIGIIDARDEATSACVASAAGRRAGDAHHQGLQDGEPRVPARAHGGHAWTACRSAARSSSSWPVPARWKPREQVDVGGARRCAPRRVASCAAAPSSRARRPTASRGWARRACRSCSRPGRETGLPIVTEVITPDLVPLVSALRRHPADRRAQHAELRAARGGGQGAQAGPAQARHDVHDRGAAAWPPSTSCPAATSR